MSETPPASPNPTTADRAGNAAVVDDDPLRSLHKMSRTAGLGSNEYVAVNPIAVASVLFGLASSLVIFDAIFLIVPAVAVILGVVALYQIRNSNGTQTGRGLSLLAIGLAVLFTAVLGSKQIMQIVGTQGDKRKIEQLVRDFGADVAARNYDAAYALMSPRFTERVSKADFVKQFNGMQDSPNYGQIQSMQWNELVNFDLDARNNDRIAGSVAIITIKGSERTGQDRREIRFRQRGDGWLIDDIPELFPPPPSPTGPGGPGGPAGQAVQQRGA
jgi:hypothetical protein